MRAMRVFNLIAALSVCTAVLGLAPVSMAQSNDAPATIRVSLPTDASLTVDGEATQSTTGTRWFTTPVLEPGKNYFYNFKASFVRDGKTISVEQKVRVRPGQETVVSMNLPGSEPVAETRNLYYPAQTSASTTRYYFSPSDFAPIAPVVIPSVPFTSEWVPGNYQIYNP